MFRKLRNQKTTTIAAFVASAGAIIGASVFGVLYGMSSKENTNDRSGQPQPSYCNSTDIHHELGILAHIFQDNVTVELNADCLEGIERIELHSNVFNYYFNHTFLSNETFDVHLHYNTSVQECEFGIIENPFFLHVDCNEVFPPSLSSLKLGGSLFVPRSSPLHNSSFIGLMQGGEEFYLWGETRNFEFSRPFWPNDTYDVVFSNSSFYDFCKIENGNGTFHDDDILNVIVDCDHPCPSPPPKPTPSPKVGGFLETNCTHVDLHLYQEDVLVETQHRDVSSFFKFSHVFVPGTKYTVVGQCPFDGKLCEIDNSTGLVGDENVNDVLVKCFESLEKKYQLRIFHTISPKSHVYTFPVQVTLTSDFVNLEEIVLTPGELYVANTSFFANETFYLLFSNPDHEEACEISEQSGTFVNQSISVWVNCPMFLMPIEIEANVKEEDRGQYNGIELIVESGNMLDELVLFIQSSDVEIPNMGLSSIINNLNVTYNLFGYMVLTPMVYENRFIHLAWFDGVKYQMITNLDNRYSMNSPYYLLPPVLETVHINDCLSSSYWVFNSTSFPVMTMFYLYDDALNDAIFTSYVLGMGEGMMNVSFTPRKTTGVVSYWIRALEYGVESQMSNIISVTV